MSDEKQPEQKPTKQAAPQQPRGDKPEPIAVRVVKFDGHVDIYGRGHAQSVTADPERPKNLNHWTIEYLPWMRNFRVTFYAAGGKPPKVEYVLDHKVATWEPAA